MIFFKKKKEIKEQKTIEESKNEILQEIEEDNNNYEDIISMSGPADNDIEIEIAGNDPNTSSFKKTTNKIFKKKNDIQQEEKPLPDDLKQFGFVEMTGNIPSTEFEIIQDKKNIKGYIIGTLKILLTFIVITLGIAFIYFCLSFKVIKEDIRGASLKINVANNEYSILSKNHSPNLDELKVGDTLITIDSKYKDSFLPYIFKYTKIKYSSRNGVVIYGTDLSGANRKISSSDIVYVIPQQGE